ncbi:MAG: glycosyltransferase family 2 protein [Candidatus Micrarchaeota archaeon]|nr:glycosyltransferase family 2 protein [Candidatus Micrarchaeota archaeon]MCX8154429.1 glycosyltransferase family 2 protein [Candidatus Micrarchaeota archaeon]
MIERAILLPTYNEQEGIEKVIQSIRSVDRDVRIILADSSNDNTPEIAKRLGADVIRTERRGKAYAVRDAFSKIEADKLIMMDADGTYPVEEIPVIFDMLEKYDIVFTSRMRGVIENGAMPLINRFTNLFTSAYARLILDSNFTDVMSGMVGMRRDTYKRLEIYSNRFELEIEIVVETVAKRFRAAEIPIRFRSRYGVPKIEWIDGFRILFHLTKRALPLLSRGLRGWRVDMYGQEISRSIAQRSGSVEAEGR